MPDVLLSNKKRRFRWTTPEKHQVRERFSCHIKGGEMPTAQECENLRSSLNINRSAMQIQTWVRAEIQRKNRMFSK